MTTFFIIETLFGAIGAWSVSLFAPRLGLIDTPSERSSHTIPTPKGGGIGLLAAFIWASFILKIDVLFYMPIVLISLISLVGDRNHLPPSTRLILQFSIAFTIIFTHFGDNFFLKTISLPSHDLLLTFVVIGILPAIFMIGTANFYNFMDGINGIAGVTGMIAFCLLAGYGVVCGKDHSYSMLCAGISMACLGFLPFNLPKAKVFMGDVGSILLGFVFAVIVLIFTQTILEFIVLSGFLFPFYADEIVTMFERLRDHHNLLTPHRRHLYQVLANEAGIAHWKISLAYGAVQLVVGISLWLMSEISLLAVLTALFLFSFCFLLLNFLVKRHFASLQSVIKYE